MEYKANINYSNVGFDDAKVTLQYFVIDPGSVEDAEAIVEEFNKLIKKKGGVPKESKKKDED